MDDKEIKRYGFLKWFSILLIVVFAVRLIYIQGIQGPYYSEISAKNLYRSTNIKAPRGEIYDRYGRVLVTNEMAFSIVLYKMDLDDASLNKSILKAVNLLDTHNVEYADSLPISKTEPFVFTYIADDEKYKDFKSSIKLPETATVSDVLEYYRKNLKIDPSYSLAEARKIIGVRYEMKLHLFGANNPYTLATNVSEQIVTRIKETQDEFPGVSITTEPVRTKPYGTLGAHFLGRVGPIYKEEYDTLKNKGYKMNDALGKDGMEEYLESYLKGTDGISSIQQDLNGKVVSTFTQKDPVPGDFAVLTIDAELQKTAEEALQKTINDIRAKSGGDANNGADAFCGAVSVVDVKTGELLALASCPTYNDQDYSNLINDKNKPLFNRAISGAYAPGSTFKMVTALGALQDNVITPTETVLDKGIYMFYEPTYTPKCWIYPGSHGYVNVSNALKVSCNYFFYDVGRRLTIEKLDDFAKQLGLGESTGIELKGESKGILSSPEYKQQNVKEEWYPGDTLQSAIGQSYNMFTPLQLANYVATIVNGGTRHSIHIVKDVYSYSEYQPVLENKPEALNQIDIRKENFNAVMDGMRSVTEDGTASSTFANFPISVGGKTGTAQVPGSPDNGLFVAFAPFDDPQIAISVVVEKAAHGGYVAPIARDIMTKYFMLDTTPQPDYIQKNVLMQ